MTSPSTKTTDTTNPSRIDRILALSIFGALVLALTALLIARSPTWGLMDDATLLGTARAIGMSDSMLAAVVDQSLKDLAGWGIFRPVYWVWVTLVYQTFEQWPVGAYLVTMAFNFLALLIWGAALTSVFDLRDHWRPRGIFLLPLLAFAFPPYWNLYQYISLQEKFIVLFSGIAVLAFSQSVQRAGGHLWTTVGFASVLLGLLSKPTMIALPMAMLGVLILRALLRDREGPTGLWSAFAFTTVGLYLAFTLTIQTSGVYTASYAESLGFSQLLARVATAPRFVIALAGLALLAGACSLSRREKAGGLSLGVEAILPMSLLAYLVILLPWGYPTYLLSGLTPFALGSALIVVRRAIDQLGVSRVRAPRIRSPWFHAFVVGVLLVVIPLDVVPKTQWLADVRETQTFLRGEVAGVTYFFPPPFVEHAGSLAALTGKDVQYLSDGRLSRMDDDGAGELYLVTYLDQGPVLLDGFALGQPVFSNGTWAVLPLLPADGVGEELFSPVFPQAAVPLGRRVRQILG